MLRATYSAISAMKSPLDNIHLIANNIANAQTLGYRRSEIAVRSFQDIMVELENGSSLPIGTGIMTDETAVDFTHGVFKPTDNKFDLAIGSEGFFTIKKKDSGITDVTRDGRFKLNSSLQLTTMTDDLVLDTSNNPITLTNNNNMIVKSNGDIYEDKNKVATLKIQLAKQDSSTLPEKLQKVMALILPTDQLEAKPVVQQGFVETSNVQIVREMVNLITTSKQYEKGQKIISTADKILDKAINEMGRVS